MNNLKFQINLKYMKTSPKYDKELRLINRIL